MIPGSTKETANPKANHGKSGLKFGGNGVTANHMQPAPHLTQQEYYAVKIRYILKLGFLQVPLGARLAGFVKCPLRDQYFSQL